MIIFVFKHQSLRTCKVTIVDRTGKVVYKRKIEDIYTWDGWDGHMHDSNREAPEGQYYFVVEAMGYDGVEYSDPTLREQRKLNGGISGQQEGAIPTETSRHPIHFIPAGYTFTGPRGRFSVLINNLSETTTDCNHCIYPAYSGVPLSGSLQEQMPNPCSLNESW